MATFCKTICWDVDINVVSRVDLPSFSLCVWVCGKLFHGHKFFTSNIHFLPCDFAVSILWGEVSFSRTLNLDQTHFAVINRMWQKLGCVSVSLGFQRPCIFYYLSWCIFLRIPSLHPTLRIYSRLLGVRDWEGAILGLPAWLNASVKPVEISRRLA